MNEYRSNARHRILAAALLLGGCALQAPNPDSTSASDTSRKELACTLPGNCVDSVGTGGLAPLHYAGTPAQAMATLQSTLTNFPEARIVRSEPLLLETIFTTPVGFRDQVEFRIDEQARRIDFRSRSTFGLFDFGKNRSRMQTFAARFEQQEGR
jgi:uncharacterized protein (DUF1499 family)